VTAAVRVEDFATATATGLATGKAMVQSGVRVEDFAMEAGEARGPTRIAAEVSACATAAASTRV
jgi:hypothetical protein